MLAGIPAHIVQRGNNRTPCFLKDEERAFYLHHLDKVLPRFGCALHAYCLMTNHVHLLLTPAEEDSCGALMKHVAQLHSQYFNRQYKRTGSLWEGRFRSCLVQSEGYLLSCYRYIELNPVRAGLVPHPADHPWSSFRENALGEETARLTPHFEYLRLGRDAEERRASYRTLFEPLSAGQLDEIRAATNGGYALGDETFKRSMALKVGRRVEEGRPGRPPTRNVVCP